MRIDIQLNPSDFSIEASAEMTFPQCHILIIPFVMGSKCHETPPPGKVMKNNTQSKIMPSVVNFDEEIRSCADLSSDDEMIEIICNTPGLPGPLPLS